MCLSIVLQEIPAGLPAKYLTGGLLLLDTDSQSTTSLNKSIQELSEVNEIKDEIIYDLSIPRTGRNDIALRSFLSPVVYQRTFEPLEARVTLGGLSVDTSHLNVVTVNKDRFEIELIRTDVHWISGAARTKLRDIDWGTFNFTVTNIGNSWNKFAYVKDTAGEGIMFPVVNYGKFFFGFRVVPEDTRPWFSLPHLLYTAFCHLGWELVCPILDTKLFNQTWCYILGKDYGNEAALVPFREFAVRYYTDGATIVEEEIHDLGDVFPEGVFVSPPGLGTVGVKKEIETSAYTTPAEADFIVEGTAFFGNLTTALNKAYVELIRRHSDGREQVLASQEFTLPAPGFADYNIYIIARNVLVGFQDQVFVRIRSEAQGAFAPDVVFYNKVNRVFYLTGDTINLNETIHKEYTVLDLFKGFVHLINGKIETNRTLKQVYVSHPHERTLFKDTPDEIPDNEGFFLPNAAAIDLYSKSNGEARIINDKRDKVRFHRYAFRDSTDPYIRNLNLDEELHSKLFDLGEEYGNEDKIYVNPFFEPTHVDFIDQILGGNNGVPLYIPFLLDNTDGRLSYEIGPRVLFCAGNVGVAKLDPNEVLIDIDFRWGWALITVPIKIWPVMFHVTDQVVVYSGANKVVPDIRLIYGNDDRGFDIFTFFYFSELMRNVNTLRVQLDVALNSQDYRLATGRTKYKVPVFGREVFGFLDTIDNFSPCSFISATMTIVPEVGIEGLCPPESEPGDPPLGSPCGANAPNLILTEDPEAGCVSAVKGGSYVSTIINETLEISVDGGVPVTYVEGTPVCAPFEIVEFIWTIDFEDCPGRIVRVPYVFDRLCIDEPAIELIIDQTSGCIVAVGDDSEIFSIIDTDVWEFSFDDITYFPYNEGDQICDYAVIYFRRTVNFTNDCPEEIVTSAHSRVGDEVKIRQKFEGLSGVDTVTVTLFTLPDPALMDINTFAGILNVFLNGNRRLYGSDDPEYGYTIDGQDITFPFELTAFQVVEVIYIHKITIDEESS